MKKKGFTLVELLAVIAILAILVIIALPNVIGLFQSAQRNSLVNEAREVYNTARNQWLVSGLGSATTDTTYTDSGSNKLSLDGRDISYKVTVETDGKITYLHVCDLPAKRGVKVTGTDIKVDDIKISNIEDDISTCD